MTDNNWARKLLIVEGDAQLRSQLKWSLEGFEVRFAEGRQQALSMIRLHEPQVVLQDLGLSPDPEGNTDGFATLTQILELAPAVKVIALTDSCDRDRAVKAVAMGAYDFAEKPLDLNLLRPLVGRAFHIARLEHDVLQLRRRAPPETLEDIIAVDRAMMDVCRIVEKVAPTALPVLFVGESGTGKELLARMIHDLSGRASKRFISVNCAAIPEQRLESELFGYAKGAFPGATKATPGKLECADGGTLFLDEVSAMPLSLQARMLRFLQDRVIERVGGRLEIPVDIRVVSATNQNLQTLIRAQRFGQDLYFKLSEVTVNVPPLRDRAGDVLAIAHTALTRFAKAQGKTKRGFTDEALQLLTAYNWPGNVRELENRVKVACLLGDDTLVSGADLGLNQENGIGVPLNLRAVRSRAERDAVTRAMSAAAGNVSKAAEFLGVSRPTLYDLMSRHNMPLGERREAAMQPNQEGAT